MTAPGRIDATMSSDHEHRRAAAGYEHRADDEIGVAHGAGDRCAVARERLDAALVDLVDPAEPVDVLVEQEHLGFHALRDPRGVPTDVARAQHHDTRGPHARCAAEEHAAPTLATLEEVGTDLRGHAPGDLAHRREQRQLPVGELHGLVRRCLWCRIARSAWPMSGYAARWR